MADVELELLDLLSQPNAELTRVDPLVMNLVVAKGLPSLSDLDICHYVELRDQWAEAIRNWFPKAQLTFQQSPQDWNHDIDYFKLALICEFIDVSLGIAYREDQRDVKRIRYTDATDLFLNGVMDTRRGTCGNMAVLHVALGWRLGLPVSISCVGSHLMCRYDNGKVTYNIEATETGRGGFSSQTDEYVRNKSGIPEKAVRCGSDLRALSPREMLGVFIGLRARHLENVGQMESADVDYSLARYLYPKSRNLSSPSIRPASSAPSICLSPAKKGIPRNLRAGCGKWLL